MSTPVGGYAILGALASREGEAGGAPVARSAPADDDAARSAALSYLDSLVGTPYLWASKDPAKGLDCSGALVVSYERGGLALPGARYKYGSADLYKKLRPTSSPRRGDAVFYGSAGKVSHVMMYAGDGRVLGAMGGGRGTTTVEAARAAGAYVKYKPADYRKDLVGYGQAPSASAPLAGSLSARLDTSDSREERAEKIGYGIAVVVFAALGAWGARWIRRSAR